MFAFFGVCTDIQWCIKQGMLNIANDHKFRTKSYVIRTEWKDKYINITEPTNIQFKECETTNINQSKEELKECETSNIKSKQRRIERM